MKAKLNLLLGALALFTPYASRAALADASFTRTFEVLENSDPAVGEYDFAWLLYDASSGGNQIGTTLILDDIYVEGSITVPLNFGPVDLYANNLWVEFRKRPSSVNTSHLPQYREQLLPTTRALYAHKAGSVTAGAIGSSQIANGAIVAGHIGAGAITAAGLANNSVTSAKLVDGAGSGVDSDLFDGLNSTAFWQLGGNAGVVPGSNFIGTSDNQALEFKVNNHRVLRFDPTASAPNIIAGWRSNRVDAPGIGSSILGGGIAAEPNIIAGSYSSIVGGYGNIINTNATASSIAGGRGNVVGNLASYVAIAGGLGNFIASNAVYSAIGGGRLNTVSTNVGYSAISGGYQNSIEPAANYFTISGGRLNTIRPGALYSTISGGYINTNNATYSTISGGTANLINSNAFYSSISGGGVNTIQNNTDYAVIAGGQSNLIGTNADWAVVIGGRGSEARSQYSLATGRRAKALHAGAMVIADSTDAELASTEANQLAIRARGGVKIDTAGKGLTVDGAQVLTTGSGTTVADGSITTLKLADASVTTAKIAENAITAAKITSAAVTSAKLADSSVATAKLANNAVTTAKIADGAVTAAKLADGSGSGVDADLFDGLNSSQFLKIGGNAGISSPVFGTTDNQPVDIIANNARVLRLQPTGTDPNIIAGAPSNAIEANTIGATISGGSNNELYEGADHSTIGGGQFNFIGNDNTSSVIAGGVQNYMQGGYDSVIGGGRWNALVGAVNRGAILGGTDNEIQDASNAAIVGGQGNSILGDWNQFIGGGGQNHIATGASSSAIVGGWMNSILNDSFDSAIGGGLENVIQSSSGRSTIAGGMLNYIGSEATNSTISGGFYNTIASGIQDAMIPGGRSNSVSGHASMAAGYRAQALHNGTFVWADSQNSDFSSSADNQFAVRAHGGVMFETGGAGLTIDGNQLFTTSDDQFDLYAGGQRGFRIDSQGSGVNTIGGFSNAVTGENSYGNSISGGSDNLISEGEFGAEQNFIGAGAFNSITGGSINSSILGGYNNTIYGSGTDYGYNSVILGGSENDVYGNYSVAGGRRAKAYGSGSFVWADSQDADFYSSTENEFAVRAFGGVRLETGGIGINLDGAATLAPYGFYSNSSWELFATGSVWLYGTTVDIQAASGPLTMYAGGDVTVTSGGMVAINTGNGSPVQIPQQAGNDGWVEVGDRFGDNGIIAWGFVDSAGNVSPRFGVQTVERLSTGVYEITVTASATQLVPTVVAEVEAAPTTASTARLVTVNTTSANTFRVYITNGSYAAVNNDFTFSVTGR